jgi:hypothetical protein
MLGLRVVLATLHYMGCLQLVLSKTNEIGGSVVPCLPHHSFTISPCHLLQLGALDRLSKCVV